MAIKDHTNWHEVARKFRSLQEEYNQAVVMWLASLGERVVTYARDNGSYTDRTENLRHSIGYVIVQNGKVMNEDFSAGNSYPEAQQKARTHALEVARSLSPGKTYLVWVAGMEYASYVEAKGFDVIEGSGNWVESTAETLKAEFVRFLKHEMQKGYPKR